MTPAIRTLTLTFLTYFFATLLSVTAHAQVEREIYSKVRFHVVNESQIPELAWKGVVLDHAQRAPSPKGGLEYTTVLNSAELALLAGSGLSYEVLVPDMAAEFVSRPVLTAEERLAIDAGNPLEGFELGSMGGFYTFDEVMVELDSMRLLYPNLISVRQSIGQSHEGRDIWMVRISDNPDVDESEPEVLYTSLHHAREPQSLMTVMYFMYHLLENYGTDPDVTLVVNNRELYFVPVINPDGYVYNQTTDPNGGGFWRKNRRNNLDGTFGVDLNRNYGFEWGFDNIGSSPSTSSDTYRGPSAFSEPETQAIRDLCESHRFAFTLNYHSAGDLLIYPWGYLPSFFTPDSAQFVFFASEMTQFNNYVYGTGDQTVGYVVNGDSDDWMYGEQTSKNKTFSMTPEVGPAFWPSQSLIVPIAQENLFPNMYVAINAPLALETDPEDPNNPENVTSYSDYTTPGSIELNWIDPVTLVSGDTLTNFGIEIWRGGDSLTFVASGVQTLIDDGGFLDGTVGLVDGQFYEYTFFARDLNTDSLSNGVETSAWSGGAPTPDGPAGFFITTDGSNLVMHWTNPTTQIDGTPLDDFAGIKLYEDGAEVMSYARANSDTGAADSAVYAPPAGTHSYYVTAFDDEIPFNESDPGNSSFSPIQVPVFDAFTTVGNPSEGFWINNNAEVNSSGVNEPSAPNSLDLNGNVGGDDVTLLPVDISSMQDSALIVSYWYQPQGTGNAPESTDSFFVELKNDLGQWRTVRRFGGTNVMPFVNDVVLLDSESAGAGATFFHHAFQFRFRTASSPTGSFDDWFVDDVFFGPDQVVGINDGFGVLPGVFSLHQNYPNPFNPTTKIRYDLPQNTKVKVTIYNLLGQEVRTLVSRTQAAGYRSVTWDGKNNLGATVSSGIYVYRIQAGSFVQSRKMMYLK